MKNAESKKIMQDAEGESEQRKGEHIRPGTVAIATDVAVTDFDDSSAWIKAND